MKPLAPPIDAAMQAAQPEETVTVEIPRSVFDAAKTFIQGFGQVLDAADASLKADTKAKDAHSKIAEGLGGLEGFGDELNAASQGGLGLPTG